jgi:hypothetical protein
VNWLSERFWAALIVAESSTDHYKEVKYSYFQHHYFPTADSIAQQAFLVLSCQVCNLHLIRYLDLGLLLPLLSEYGFPRAVDCSDPRVNGVIPILQQTISKIAPSGTLSASPCFYRKQDRKQ